MRLIVALWRSIGGIATMGVLMIVIGGLLSFGTFGEACAYMSTKEPVNIYDVKEEELKTNIWVKCDIDYVLDGFAENEHTTKNRSGSVTGRYSDYYYMIPVNGKDGNAFMIAIKVSDKNMNLYDNIVNNTWDYLNYETDTLEYKHEFEGTTKKLDDEIYEYMIDMMVDDYEYDEDEAREMSAPIVLESSNVVFCTKMMGVGSLLFMGGVAILVVGLILRNKSSKVVNVTATMVSLNGRIDNVMYSQVASEIGTLSTSGPGAYVNVMFQNPMKGMTSFSVSTDMMTGLYNMTITRVEKGQQINYMNTFNLQDTYGCVGKIFMQKELPNVKKWNRKDAFNSQMVG